MRHELIDGEHVVTPTPNRKHQAVSLNLSGPIWSYLQQRPIGRVFAAPFDVILSAFEGAGLALSCRDEPASAPRRG